MTSSQAEFWDGSQEAVSDALPNCAALWVPGRPRQDHRSLRKTLVTLGYHGLQGSLELKNCKIHSGFTLDKTSRASGKMGQGAGHWPLQRPHWAEFWGPNKAVSPRAATAGAKGPDGKLNP